MRATSGMESGEAGEIPVVIVVAVLEAGLNVQRAVPGSDSEKGNSVTRSRVCKDEDVKIKGPPLLALRPEGSIPSGGFL